MAKWVTAGYVHPTADGGKVNVRIYKNKEGGETDDYVYSLSEFQKINGDTVKSAKLLKRVE